MGLLYGTLCYYKLNGWLLSHWATVFTQCKFSFLKSENKKKNIKRLQMRIGTRASRLKRDSGQFKSIFPSAVCETNEQVLWQVSREKSGA